MYTVEYETTDGILLQDELNAYSLDQALKEAKGEAKRNGWKVKSIKPKVYPPHPIVYEAPKERYPDYTIR